MNLSAKMFLVLAFTFLFRVEAQQNKISQAFTAPDSVQVKAKLFDSLMQTKKHSMDLPPAIGPFMKIYAYDHPAIGRYIIPFKDVNGDGFNDFAVSTPLDTTFIFFGGPNMDDKPHAFVLGGGAGILAGDVNGDGYTDIITSQADYYGKMDPEYRGLVRIYLHNKTTSMYNAQPDIQLIGVKDQAIGHPINGMDGIHGGDFNGDGKYDFLAWANEPNGFRTGVLKLYLGKSNPDTIPDFQYKDWGQHFSDFGEKSKVIDVNGDGYDDIVIPALNAFEPGGKRLEWGIYLGRNNINNIFPDRIDSVYRDESGSIDYVDMNGDGCPEIQYETGDLNPIFCCGYCGNDFLTKQDFKPDTSFPNEFPDSSPFAFHIRSIGKFFGTNYNDYVVVWLVSFMGNPLGIACHLYKGGPGFQPKTIVYYGVPDGEIASAGPIPLGDITGDGIDDFATYCGDYSLTATRYAAAIWLFKGDKSLVSTVSDKRRNASDDFNIEVYPNPVLINKDKYVTLECKDINLDEINIQIIDMLGRMVLDEKKELNAKNNFLFKIDISKMPTGIYNLIVRNATRQATKRLSIIHI